MACNNCNDSTPCNCNNNCNDCGNTHIQTHICDPCNEPTPCDCPIIDLSTDCVLYDQDDIKCERVVVVPKNTSLTEALRKIVAWACTKFSEVQNYFVVKNVGNGAGVYKGTNLIGEKELKSLTSTDSSITITPNTDTVNLLVNFPEDSTCITSSDNSVTIIQDFDTRCFDLEVNFPKTCITSTDGSVAILTDSEGCFDLSVNFSEHCIVGQNGITVTGVDDCLVISTTIDGSETKIADGVTTNITGVGTTASPYVVEIENLQKVVSTFPYTLTSADDKYTIFVNNGASNVLINVPNGLVANFSCVFIQEGTGLVTIQASGTATVLYPSTLQNKIKAQNYWAMVEKKQATDNYFLLGSLMPI